MRPKISACIITKNEASKIKACLESLSFVDEIIVVDSKSSDDTRKIAREFGAKVVTREFSGYGEQKNKAIEEASYDWIFSIDADERVSQELQEEINTLDFSIADGFEIPRLTYFLGKPIMHGGYWWYPGYVLRLFNKKKGKFRDIKVHETVEVTGTVKKLQHPLHHFTYRDLNHYIQKVNSMTDWQSDASITPWKNSNYLMMFVKAAYRFLQTYIYYRGFLDGFRGFIISLTSAYYVFLVYFKSWEHTLKKQ